MPAGLIQPPEIIDTARLRLRRAAPGDAPAVFLRWAQDPDVTRFLTWRPHQTIEETRQFLEWCRAEWEHRREFVWMLEEKTGRSLVGSLAARPGVHGVNLGYLLARDAWGRGFMGEALDMMVSWWLAQPGVYRVWATTAVENTRSARVLAKAGFELEGTLRRWEPMGNLGRPPRDALCFSRVRD